VLAARCPLPAAAGSPMNRLLRARCGLRLRRFVGFSPMNRLPHVFMEKSFPFFLGSDIFVGLYQSSALQGRRLTAK
jgi:hypothetical protein